MMSEQEKKGRNYPALLIIATVLALVIVVFALQNAESVELRFFSAALTVTKAFLIFICLAIGIIIGTLFSLPGNLKKGRRARRLEKEIQKLRSAQVHPPKSQSAEAPRSKENQA